LISSLPPLAPHPANSVAHAKNNTIFIFTSSSLYMLHCSNLLTGPGFQETHLVESSLPGRPLLPFS
jgi:hypothetical protein